MTDCVVENFFWASIAGLILYIGDGTHSLFEITAQDPRVKREWLAIGISLAILNALVFLYLYYGAKCWVKERRPEVVAPRLADLGALLLSLSGISFMFAFWEVFHYLTFLVIPLLFAGFVFMIDLVPGRQILIEYDQHQRKSD